jgi:hypothetical protein
MECKSTQIFDNCKSSDKKTENNSKNAFQAYLTGKFLLNYNDVCIYVNLIDYFRLHFYSQIYISKSK